MEPLKAPEAGFLVRARWQPKREIPMNKFREPLPESATSSAAATEAAERSEGAARRREMDALRSEVPPQRLPRLCPRLLHESLSEASREWAVPTGSHL